MQSTSGRALATRRVAGFESESVAGFKSEQVAGFKSELPAAFLSESVAGFRRNQRLARRHPYQARQSLARLAPRRTHALGLRSRQSLSRRASKRRSPPVLTWRPLITLWCKSTAYSG